MAERTEPGLCGLARNPAAPDDVLVRLARYARAAHEMSHRRQTLSDPVVTEILAHRNPSSVLHLGRSRVSAAMLARIAADPDPAIRDARSSVFRDWVKGGLLTGIEDVEEVFGQPIAVLAGNPDPEVRTAVARAWWARSADIHTMLLTDPDSAVRAAASRGRPHVPAELHTTCLADPATRANVASYAELTPEQAMALATDSDDHVRDQAALNPALTAEAVAVLVADPHPFVRGNIVMHRLVDAETRDRLYAQLAAEAAAGTIDAEVALEWNFHEPYWVRDEPLPARLSYVESQHVVFRRAVAGSHPLPEAAWQRLDEDPDWLVRRRAAMRPDAPPALLERIAREAGDDDRHQRSLLDHPNFPREVLPDLADEPEPRARRMALKDPALPRRLLARLCVDPDDYVRRAAASHSGVDDELLTLLLADRDDDVVANAAANPALPVERMYDILTAAGL